MADKIGTDEYGEVLIYQTDDGQTNIEVKIEDDTVWLTQQQLTELYQCSKSKKEVEACQNRDSFVTVILKASSIRTDVPL